MSAEVTQQLDRAMVDDLFGGASEWDNGEAAQPGFGASPSRRPCATLPLSLPCHRRTQQSWCTCSPAVLLAWHPCPAYHLTLPLLACHTLLSLRPHL